MVISTNIFEETQTLFDQNRENDRSTNFIVAPFFCLLGLYGLYKESTSVAYPLLALAFYYFVKGLWNRPYLIITPQGLKWQRYFSSVFVNWDSIHEITSEKETDSTLKSIFTYSSGFPRNFYWITIAINGNNASPSLLNSRILRIPMGHSTKVSIDLGQMRADKCLQALNDCRTVALQKH